MNIPAGYAMDEGVIGTKPKADLGPLFAHPADELAGYADLASSDGADRMLALAERAATIRLNTFGSFMSWEIRCDLILARQIDGTEKSFSMGQLCTRMGVVRTSDVIERVPSLLPTYYLTRADGTVTDQATVYALRRVIEKAHKNYNSRWRRPTASERAEQCAREQARPARPRKKGKAA